MRRLPQRGSPRADTVAGFFAVRARARSAHTAAPPGIRVASGGASLHQPTGGVADVPQVSVERLPHVAGPVLPRTRPQIRGIEFWHAGRLDIRPAPLRGEPGAAILKAPRHIPAYPMEPHAIPARGIPRQAVWRGVDAAVPPACRRAYAAGGGRIYTPPRRRSTAAAPAHVRHTSETPLAGARGFAVPAYRATLNMPGRGGMAAFWRAEPEGSPPHILAESAACSLPRVLHHLDAVVANCRACGGPASSSGRRPQRRQQRRQWGRT